MSGLCPLIFLLHQRLAKVVGAGVAVSSVAVAMAVMAGVTVRVVVGVEVVVDAGTTVGVGVEVGWVRESCTILAV